MNYDIEVKIISNEQDYSLLPCVPVIIAAYEPDFQLINLLKELKASSISPIILVNDGSGSKYNNIFEESIPLSNVYIVHKNNYGKGKALKTAFSYVIQHYPKSIGVVTADSDGQHSVLCIKEIINKLKQTQNSLILGVRDFDEENIPYKSRMGNKLTRKLLYFITGIKIKDSQTGLRGIPFSFLKDCLTLSGERFDFEMQMLLKASRKIPIEEVPIKTIYDCINNHKTHFNPLTDSIKIYGSLFYQFIKYTFSALSSFILDVFLFSVFFFCLFNKYDISLNIMLSTLISRTLSVTYNYFLNYKFVFMSSYSVVHSAMRYFSLAIAQMILSTLCTVGLVSVFSKVSVVGLKIIVDIILFLVSYYIQKEYIFLKSQHQKGEK